MLVEQLEFLRDGWDMMLRCADQYDIDLDWDDAFKTLKLGRAHALRVAEQAFYILDQFLFPQKDPYRGDGTNNSQNAEQKERITGNGGMYPTEVEQHIKGCGQAIQSSVDRIAGDKDVASLL